MAPTGRGGLRPYQPSKFQPFIIVCLIVTVIVVGFNFWNLMKKNSLLLVEIGKIQRDFKRVELEKKDCYVQFKDAEEKRKKHEDADHEKEILLEDTRRIVEDLKSEGDTLRQNITRLQSHIESAELLDNRKEKKSQSECEQKLEELRLQSQSSCDTEKETLQQETTDQLNTMKKQLKLQYEKTQQLDQMLQQQQQKQRATEEETKGLLQPASNSPPVDNTNVQQQGGIQKQQRQQQQLQKQQHEEQRLEQQWQEKRREEQKEMQQNTQVNGQVDQKLSSGQQIQRQGQQNGSVGDHRRQRSVQGNGAYRQFGKQNPGLRPKNRRQVPVGRMDQREQTQGRDTDPVRQGEQQQGENKERTERDQSEEVQRVRYMHPPQRIKQETNGDERQKPGSTQVPGIGEQSKLEQPQGDQRLLFKRSDQNATVLVASGGSELAADESKSETSDQLKENLPRPNNDAVDDDTAKPNRDDVDELKVQAGDGEKVNEAASVKPPSDKKLIQNEQDHQDLRQDGQDKNRSPYHDRNSLDPEKAPAGNAEV